MRDSAQRRTLRPRDKHLRANVRSLETPLGWQQVEAVTYKKGCATHWAVLWGMAWKAVTTHTKACYPPAFLQQ